jgi:hypothetical protein
MSIESTIAKITELYDGDNDLIPDGPLVTWGEYLLANSIELLLKRVEELEEIHGVHHRGDLLQYQPMKAGQQ